MADPDLQNALSQFQPIKILEQAQQEIAKALGVVMPNLWETSKDTIIYLILLFFVIKYFDRGIGSVVYNLIYLLIAFILIYFLGWGVLFENWFEFLYPLSYILTRIALKKLGIWKY